MTLPQTPSFRLDGKQALIVGASSGIGLGAAVALADAGASVVVAARREEQLAQLVETLSSNGRTAKALPLDICDLAATQKAAYPSGCQRLIGCE